MSIGLIAGIVVVVVALIAGVMLWRLRLTSGEPTPHIEIEITAGSAAVLRTTSVRGRDVSSTLRLTNTGQVATTVEDLFLDVPGGWRVKMNVSYDGGSLLLSDRPLPCRLGPGETVRFGMPRDILESHLREMGALDSDKSIVVEVRDVTNTTYTEKFPVERLIG
jgi:hypothetical protein